ncbi:hypothetical protein EOM81_01725 [bacterium]|nr:hypothetical protein [bacterium]
MKLRAILVAILCTIFLAGINFGLFLVGTTLLVVGNAPFEPQWFNWLFLAAFSLVLAAGIVITIVWFANYEKELF